MFSSFTYKNRIIFVKRKRYETKSSETIIGRYEEGIKFQEIWRQNEINSRQNSSKERIKDN